MPLIRINAEGNRPVLHLGQGPVGRAIRTADTGRGPVIVMVHGFSYQPGHVRHCPHRHILALQPDSLSVRTPSWPHQMGFCSGDADEGLGIAFGWNARGPLWQAQRRAQSAGHALARLLRLMHARDPARPVHIMSHSLGIEPALEALHHLPGGAVHRVIAMTGASYGQRVRAALDSPAGRAAEFFNVTSRENDLFDFLFERLTAPPARGDRALGQGVQAPNAVTVQLDCPRTLAHLQGLGAPVAAPQARICHGSAYTRPGVLGFYNALLRHPEALPLEAIRKGLPHQPAPRWSRLLRWPAPTLPLPFAQKPS